jgi:hypothetical protein
VHYKRAVQKCGTKTQCKNALQKCDTTKASVMTISIEQLAELLAGVARSQQAVIDAIEGESAGWRNRHLLQKLNVAANLRIPEPRLLDIPSRILLRSQTRVPMDAETIARDLRLALGGAAAVATPVVALAGATTVGLGSVAAVAAAPAMAGTIDESSFFDS